MSIKTMIKELILLPSNFKNKINKYIHRIVVGNNVKFRGEFSFFGNGKLKIGDNSTINSGIIANPVGGSKTVFYIINESTVEIGKNCGISNSVICSAKGITIGDRTIIGGNCCIYDTDFHSTDYIKRRMKPDTDIQSKPIAIGEDVFIGANSIILKGVTIGNRSIIASGSVITKDIPDDELWGGNPAKKIRDLNQ